MDYGTPKYNEVTKMKPYLIRHILKLAARSAPSSSCYSFRLGYDVTWSDPDIVWFQNPLPMLQEMQADLAIQSDAAWPESPNDNFLLCSGFYRRAALNCSGKIKSC